MFFIISYGKMILILKTYSVKKCMIDKETMSKRDGEMREMSLDSQRGYITISLS